MISSLISFPGVPVELQNEFAGGIINKYRKMNDN